MSDPKPAWMPDWQSMQKQFFTAWTDATRGGALPSAPVHEGFDVWLKLFNSRESGNEALDRVVGSARQFAEFLQGVVGQLATTKPELNTPSAIREAIEKAFGGLGGQGNPVLDALRSIGSEGAKGFEEMFREWMKVARPLEQDARQMLALPAFGYTREQQERQQALLQAMAEYQEQNQRYNALMVKASRLGLDRFESKLAERSEPGREIGSLRALYDLYVDAAEEGYAEIAMSDEFREVYGAMVNAQMQVRRLVQGEVERHTAALGMPGRSELDTVHKRMQEMRRRIAELEARLDAQPQSAPPSPRSSPSADAAAPSKPARRPAAAKAAAAKPAARSAKAKPAAAKPAARSVEAEPAATQPTSPRRSRSRS